MKVLERKNGKRNASINIDQPQNTFSPTLRTEMQEDQNQILETINPLNENDQLDDINSKMNSNNQRKRLSLLIGIEQFESYSLGLHIFFDQLKELIKTFLILFIISVPCLYTNYNGRSIENLNQNNKLSLFLLKFTTLNQPIAPIQTFNANQSQNQIDAITSSNQLIISEFLNNIASNKTWLVIPDILYCLILIVLTIAMIKKQNKVLKKKKIQKTGFSISDFTVEVNGLPSNIKNTDELSTFFSKYGQIKQLYIGRNYSGILQHFVKQYHLKQQILQLQQHLSSQISQDEPIDMDALQTFENQNINLVTQQTNSAQNKDQNNNNNNNQQMNEVNISKQRYERKQLKENNNNDKQRQRIQKKLKQLQQDLSKMEEKAREDRNKKIGYEFYHDDYPSVNAFITFNTLTDKNNCYNNYKIAEEQAPNYFQKYFCCCFNQSKYPEDLKWRGVYTLKLNKYVSEPSNIMWENVGISSFEKQIRKVVILLLCLFLIMILISIAFIINYYLFPKLTPPTCVSNRFYTYQQAASSSKNSDCFCHQFQFDSIYQNLQILKLCNKHISQVINISYKSIMISFQTFIINFLLELFIVRMRFYFKFTSHTEQSNTIAIFIFIATSINIFLQLHLTAYGISIWNKMERIMNIQSNQIKESNLTRSVNYMVDFNRVWGFNIGLNIQYTFLINIILPHSTDFILFFITKTLNQSKQNHYSKIILTNLKEMFSTDFTIYKFQAVILNSIFFAFIYSQNAPPLLLFTLLSLIVQYWIYKYTVIKISKRTPSFDIQLGNIIFKVIPVAVILHLFVSILSFTNSNIFPNESRKPSYDLEKTYEFDLSDGHKKELFYNQEGILDRLSEMKFYIVLITLMIIALASKSYTKSMLNKITLCLKNRKTKNQIYSENHSSTADNSITFQHLLDKFTDNQLLSYDIIQNKKYSPIIELLNAKKTYPTTPIYEISKKQTVMKYNINESLEENSKDQDQKQNLKVINLDSPRDQLPQKLIFVKREFSESSEKKSETVKSESVESRNQKKLKQLPYNNPLQIHYNKNTPSNDINSHKSEELQSDQNNQSKELDYENEFI